MLGRILGIILFLLLSGSPDLLAQEKMGLELKISSNQSKDSIDHLIHTGQNLEFTWSFFLSEFRSGIDIIKGRMEAIAYPVEGGPPVVILDSIGDFKQISYQYIKVEHGLAPGAYVLHTTFYPDDQTLFEPQSNAETASVVIYGFSFEVDAVAITQYQYSEYDRKTNIVLKVKANLTCCENLLGPLSGQLKVRAYEQGNNMQEVETFYLSEALTTGSNTLEFESSLYSFDPGAGQFDQFSITLSDAYFEKHYNKLPILTQSRPFKVVDDIEEIVALKKASDPYLTYGSFIIPDSVREIDAMRYEDEAKILFGFAEKALGSVSERNFEMALQWMDSAMQHTGNHRVSSLLYGHPSLMSGLYVSLLRLLDDEEEYQDAPLRKATNFRLGEAMAMGNLMELARDSLLAMMFHSSDDQYNEDSDFYYDDRILRGSVYLKDISTKALKHFLEVYDLESADQMVKNIRSYLKLREGIANILCGNQPELAHFKNLGDDLWVYSDLFDFYESVIEFYRITGAYHQGYRTWETVNQVFEATSGNFPASFWLTGARIHEAIGAWEQADSLYHLTDIYWQQFIEEGNRNDDRAALLHLRQFNQEVFRVKREGNSEPSESRSLFPKYLTEVSESHNLRLEYVFDILPDREIANKAAFLGADYYKNIFIHNIEILREEDRFWLQSPWLRDFAFHLGREGQHEQALQVYKVLYDLDHFMTRAFRAGFSEESQIFYIQKQMETLYRMINVLIAYRNVEGETELYHEALKVVMNKLSFYQGFALRSHYLFLGNLSSKEDEHIDRLKTLWFTLREHLNELYVKNETHPDEIRVLKDYIEETEKELIRETRDTTNFLQDFSTDFENIRAALQPGEAAVEMVRLVENHQIYYGDKVRYAALIILQDRDHPELVLLPEPGQKLEEEFYRFYKNSILYRQKDTESYQRYWKPIDALMEGIHTVFWAPQGIYHLINPYTFFDPDRDVYMVDQYRIISVPTTAFISGEVPLEFSSALLLGNPVFQLDQAVDSFDFEGPTSRAAFLNSPVPLLPGTGGELAAILGLLQSSNIDTRLFVETQATKKEIFEHYQSNILHIATHGFWIHRSSEASSALNIYEALSSSGLLMANAQEKGEAGHYNIRPEGVLTASEIQDLFLFNTGLVVLSACDTGLGEVVPGEGIYGLKRAFQKAGVSNILTSLWKVDDQATRDFMIFFYESLLSKGLVSEALTDAIRQLRETHEDPYFWGAFMHTKTF